LFSANLFSFLRSLWRLSVLGAFPVIVIIYCRMRGMSFAELDQSDGIYKFQVVMLYLGYLFFWLWVNSRCFRGDVLKD
jgi:hypothetical protein